MPPDYGPSRMSGMSGTRILSTHAYSLSPAWLERVDALDRQTMSRKRFSFERHAEILLSHIDGASARTAGRTRPSAELS